jgi:N-acetylglutamate synthase-like GNAT family acetyltransferase
MLTTNVLTLKELSDDEIQLYKSWINWRYIDLFDPDNDSPSSVIIAEENHCIKGCCVLHLSLWNQVCDLKHIQIDSSADYIKTLEILVNRVISITREEGIPTLSYKYPLTPDTEVLEHYLLANGWSNKSLWLESYLFESCLFDPKWLNRKIPLPEGFTMIRWSEMTLERIESLKLMIKGGGINTYLTPFFREEYLQDLNTLILLKGERVIGWSSTHTFPDSPDTIQYSSLFIHPLWRFHGYSIRLLAESIKRHVDAGVKYGLFEVSLKECSKSWVRFIHRHLKPYSQTVTKSYRIYMFLK